MRRWVRVFSPSRNICEVSGNWLSITSTASGVIRYPIVPPRAVKMPTLRRIGANTGVLGGAAGAWAKTNEGPKAPAASAADDVHMNSRRLRLMIEFLPASGSRLQAPGLVTYLRP